MRRRLILLGSASLLLCSASASAVSGLPSSTDQPVSSSTRRAVVYAAPVRAALRVLRAFDPPDGPYGPGHRGVDLAVDASGAVLSAASGTVTFAGQVAGRGVVVVLHGDGIRTEYEPVTAAVHQGDAVSRGEVLGHVSGRHPGCPAARCLHWGARRGEEYLDPLGLLHPLGPVRLLPWTPSSVGQARG